MTKYTTFINKEETNHNILNAISCLKEKYAKIGQVCYVYNQDGIKLTETSTYHFFIDFLKPSSEIERMLIKMIVKAMYQTETISGNSSQFVFVFMLNLIQNMLVSMNSFSTTVESVDVLWENYYRSFFESLGKSVKSEDELKDFITNSVNKNDKSKLDLAIAVFEAVSLSGLEGKIFVESSKQSNYIVELKSGYSFNNLEPFSFMLDTRTKTWNRSYVKTLVVDGLIEEVSEIDALLNKASELNQPLLIISLGYGEEIAATCELNNSKGKTDVQLLKLSTDVFSVNVINDIAIVCGTTPVSSLQGEIVSMVKWEDLPTVEKIAISLKQTNIENTKSQLSVFSHMKGILDKKKNALINTPEIEDIQDIYDSRIKSLASNAVYLYIPEMSNVQSNSIRVEIDNILRNTKSLLQFGLIDKEEVKNKLIADDKKDIYAKSLKQTIEFIDNKHVPMLTIAIAFLNCSKMCNLIASSNGVVSEITTF